MNRVLILSYLILDTSRPCLICHAFMLIQTSFNGCSVDLKISRFTEGRELLNTEGQLISGLEKLTFNIPLREGWKVSVPIQTH